MFQAVYLNGKYICRTNLLINKRSFDHISFTHGLSRKSYKQNIISNISPTKTNYYNMYNYCDFHCIHDTINNHDTHLFRTLKYIYNRTKEY